MCERHRQVTVVGDDQQSFAFHVEASYVVHAGPVRGEEVKDRAPLFLIRSGAQKTAGFVKNGVHGFLWADHRVPDFHHISWTHVCGQVVDNLAVQLYLPLADEDFNATAGSKSG
jgi:hypothetical protein